MTPRVSVIVPAYNAEATIADTLSSAWNQSIRPAEIVVADDASTDRTASLAEDSGARVLRLEKGNGAIARNRAAGAASGEVLFFLDADDLWEPNKIERHLEVRTQTPRPLILDRSQAFASERAWQAGLSTPGVHPWQDLINHRAWPSGSGFSVSREAYWSVGGFHESLTKFQDVDFWIRCAAKNQGFFCLAEVLTLYRLTESGVSKGTARHDENLETMLAGWDFAAENEKEKMRRLANLMLVERLPIGQALRILPKTGFPVGNRFFWKCLLASLRRTINQQP